MFQKDEKRRNFLEMDEKHHLQLSVPYPNIKLFGAPQSKAFSVLAAPSVFGAARQRERASAASSNYFFPFRSIPASINFCFCSDLCLSAVMSIFFLFHELHASKCFLSV
jgi:hypothetical protein